MHVSKTSKRVLLAWRHVKYQHLVMLAYYWPRRNVGEAYG